MTSANIIDKLEQGSEEWHEFRKTHIGASEVAAVLGVSDFSTPHELWQLKTNRRAPFRGNFATQRGIDAEPRIRKLYEEMYMCVMSSPVMEYAEWPTLSASLDGYSSEMKTIAEFKFPSKTKHEIALSGIVPDTYIPQVQAQMLVAGVDLCHYVSYDGNDGIAVVVVKADKEYQAELLRKCKDFWKCVTDDISPIGVTDDRLDVLASEYKKQILLKEQAEEKLTVLRERLIAIIPDQKAVFSGLSLTRSMRVGSVDYKKIPELEGVDLEPYRKDPVETVTIKVVSE